MIKTLLARWRQGYRTAPFPPAPDSLPDRYRGRPELYTTRCVEGCRKCVEACPTDAIRDARGLQIDLGRCLFCAACVEPCPSGAIVFTRNYRMSARKRADLSLQGNAPVLAEALEKKTRALFGRSLKLRQVSAGGCAACEADVNVLNTLAYDLGRFGIQFVASPRHADGLLITGPVTENMKRALEKTYEAVPDPKIVIAVGACAVSGGPYAGLPHVHDGVDSTLPVDLYIPGCPPHPYTILDGLLRLLGRIQEPEK